MPCYKCIVVDDHDVDRLTVMAFIEKFDCLELVNSYTNATDALLELENAEIDVLFLDIDLPGYSGLDLRKKLAHVPVCIFITSYPEHAVESFHVETLDFMIKPLMMDRFAEAVKRIENYMEIRHKAALLDKNFTNDLIVIREGHTETKIKLSDILYLEALKDYTLVITAQKKHCVLSSIGNLLKEKPFQHFIRVHKSFAIQPDSIKFKKTQEIGLNNGIIIPVGRSYKDNLTELL